MKKYSVNIYGCDDSTSFNMWMTDEEHAFLLKAARLSRYVSTYSCQPTIEIGEALETEYDKGEDKLND